VPDGPLGEDESAGHGLDRLLLIHQGLEFRRHHAVGHRSPPGLPLSLSTLTGSSAGCYALIGNAAREPATDIDTLDPASARQRAAFVKALKTKGLFQSLAEPNLIAYNGQEASFLAGGEFPIPIVQGGSSNNAVTVVFKEFGVRLNFTPTIAGDVIRLKVRPEVSSLDFSNGITLQGFRIPALTTRRAETDVELRDGQSFAIAGLLDHVSQDDTAGIPILSKLPIIGALFKSKAERKEETELMVLITPRLVRPLNADEVPALPTNIKPFVKGGDLGQQLDGAAGKPSGTSPSHAQSITEEATDATGNDALSTR
jgi:pilus assembly protein CpaC